MFYKRLIINDMELTLAVNQTGAGAPTTSTAGSVGMLYMDTLNGDFYKCVGDTGTYTWQPLEIGGGGGGGGGGDSSNFLIVRFDFEANTASHSPSDIMAAISTGMITVAISPYYMLMPLYYVGTGHAEFRTVTTAFDNDVLYVESCSVLPDKTVTYFAQEVPLGGGGGGGGGEVVDFETDESLTLEDGVLSVNTTSVMDPNSQLPITSAGLYAVVGDIERALAAL